MKRSKIWLDLSLAMLLAGSAGAQQLSPVNPAFARWQRERAVRIAAGKESEPAKARPARKASARGGDGAEEQDFGLVPTVLDMGYLSTLNDNLTQGVGDEFPASFDLREQNALTPVRNQGSWGNCWAFAAFGSLESWIKKSEGIELDLSENHLINRHGWSQGFGKGGNAHMASGYLLRWAGPVAEGDDGYPRPGESVEGTPLRHVQRVRWIPGRTAYRDLDGIKSALMAYGALQADYYHSAGYWNAKKASYHFDVAVPGRPTNHSVDLVGWDDAYPKGNFDPPAPGNGAFLVRNSWGSGWGNDGYFWVSYYDESFAWKALYSFSNAEPADNYDGLYQHDPLGMVGSIGYGNATAWGANVFTATNASKVAAAGFYAMTPRTTYTLFVYTGCTPKAPRSGTLAAKQSGTIDLAGYATVPLESPVAVSAGQRFSVVLHLTTPGHAYPLATEYAVAGYSGAAAAHPGESFLSPNGNTWNDFTDSVASTANFCCKAYVKAQAAAKTLVSLSIDGVNTLEAGASVAFSCSAAYSDGSAKPIAPAWSIAEGGEWAEIDAAGTVRALATDEQRQVTVRADYEEGGVAATAAWKFFVTVAAPAAPADLEASQGTEDSCVRLAWSASAGASGYAVYRGTKENSGKAGYLGTVTVPRYADASAAPGVDYWYFVKAKNASGSSAFSEGAWGWRALAAPTGLTATDGSLEDVVELSWNGSEGASHYRVWRVEEIDGDYAPLSDWQTACRFADGTAEAGKAYFYAATAALDAEGTRESAFSVPDDGFCTGPVVLEALEIAGPVSLASGERGTYTCTALYTDGSRRAVVPQWTLEGGTLSFENRNAVAEAPVTGETATMTLRAEYTDGETRTGSLDITVVPVVPAAPEGLTLVSSDEEGIVLSWNAVVDATSYQLWRESADEAAAIVAAVTETEFTDKTAVPGVAYTYRVAAANGAGVGEPGAAGVTATRPIAAPTGVSASCGTYADKVVVDWLASEGAAFYRVWRAESTDGSKTALGGWQEELSIEDATGEAGTVYYYSVQAAADAEGTAASVFGEPAAGFRKAIPVPVALTVLGPGRVAAESTAAYSAKVRYDNGAVQTVSPVWSLADGGNSAVIGADGMLSVGKLGEDRTATVAASFTDGGRTVTGSLTILLIAPIEETAVVTKLEAHARWPWNGWVDVDYVLETAPSGTVAKVSLSGYDRDHGTALVATTLAGDGARSATVAAGRHRLSWNLGADYPDFHASQVTVSLDAVLSEPVAPTPLLPADLLDGLVAWWPFDGNADDASGNGNHGTVNGATLVAGRDGKADGAYHFDGNDTITVADSASLRGVTNAFSVAAWVKYDKPCTIVDSWVSILSKGTEGRQFGLNFNLTTRSTANTEIGLFQHASFRTFPEQGVWTHVAVTFDEEGFATAYVNGTAVGRYVSSPVLTVNNEELVIGADPHGDLEQLYGALDDVIVWNRALTEEEIILLCTGEKPVAPVEPSDLSDGLVAYWPFDGNAKDASGNGNHGTVNGATLVAGRDGKANGAYHFDGVDDTITVADSASLRNVTDAFSIAAWVKYDEPFITELGNWVPILSKGTSERQFGLNFNLTESSSANTEIGRYQHASFGTFPEQGVWTHVAVTFDEEGIATAYVNGNAVGRYANSRALAVNGDALIVGADPHGDLECLIGALDDVAVWNRALTAKEVARLHEGERPVEPVAPSHLSLGLVGYWPFDGDAKDASGHGNDGTVNGVTPTAGRDGNENGAYHFDGASHVQVENSSSLYNINRTVTIAAWIKPDAWYPGDGYITRDIWLSVLCKGYRTRQFCLQIGSLPAPKIVFTESAPDLMVSALPGLGEWSHVAVTDDGTELKAYLNGEPIGTSASRGGFVQTTEALYIGLDRPGGLEYFQGDMDDVAVWNRALTGEEIRELYSGGVPEGDDEDEPVAPSDDLSDGLVAYWPFDGDANDASGNGNDGTVNGATLAADRNGNADGAYRFAGASYVQVSNSSSLHGIDRTATIAAWIKPESWYPGDGTITNDVWVSVLCKGWQTRQYCLQIGSMPSPKFLFTDRVPAFTVSDLPELGEWSHVAVTDDGTTLTAYLNGTRIGTRSSPGGLLQNTEPLCIGFDPPGGDEYFQGVMDDVAVWNRALSAEEVARLAAGKTPVALTTTAQYLVVDISSGNNADSYPVSYLPEEPEGGFNTDEYKTTKLVLRRIEPGTFMMGGEYQVTLTQPYYIGVFEMTQKQWELVTGSNPSYYKGDMRPVEHVNYNMVRGSEDGARWPESGAVDASSFMGKFRARTGLPFDLPTEAQWEYACRAGTTSDYNNGGNSEDDLKQLARYRFNSSASGQSDGKGGYSQHTTVGSYLPNAWGLYDMHGNAWEWCLDWRGNLSGGVTDPKGPSSGEERAHRGGGWFWHPNDCTSSHLWGNVPSYSYNESGLRLAMTLPQ